MCRYMKDTMKEKKRVRVQITLLLDYNALNISHAIICAKQHIIDKSCKLHIKFIFFVL